MNRIVIIAVVVLLLIGGAGAGAFYMMQNKSTTNKTTQDTTDAQKEIVVEQSPTTSEVMDKKSLKDLMKVSSNQKCTFTDIATNNSGTVYTSNGRFRGDFSMVVENKTISSHMISDGEYAYTWMDGEKQGFKMSLASMNEVAGKAPDATTSKTVDINQQVDYKCRNWTVDNSVFNAPTGVTFQDYSNVMQNIKISPGSVNSTTKIQSTTDIKAAQCAACENLPADSKAACLSALKC